MNILQRYPSTRSWFDELDRLFELNTRLPADGGQLRETIHESDEAWILRLDLPGCRKEELALQVEGRLLKLRAEAKDERAFTGTVERQWKLGDGVDSGKIGARLENGVLELTLPKHTPVSPEPLNIEIL